MVFRLFILFVCFGPLSTAISCYDCLSVPQLYNYTVTADTIPKAYNDCPIKSNQTMCYISFQLLLTSNQTKIIFASTGERTEKSSVSPLLSIRADTHGSGANQSTKHVFHYSCASDQCTNVDILRRILRSSTVTDQFVDFKDLLIPVEPVDGHSCLLFFNKTESDICDMDIPTDPHQCRVCSTKDMQDSQGYRICAGCFAYGHHISAIVYEVQFDINDQTSEDDLLINCQPKHCNGIETIKLIRQKTLIQFNYNQFINDSQRSKLNITLFFMMIVLLIQTLF
ncbi:unnamed protein product [Adineta ricciae]|uniref:Uncharacterized protein n=1 Tax=Adineta ricciae TaxID=249248 RepID=A0A815S8N8_ADIRI|nr:unnamed protein product [Adineta ricciae]CAF1535379.1 unnamed protein product [Adineta ricciae]